MPWSRFVRGSAGLSRASRRDGYPLFQGTTQRGSMEIIR
jgi:hypothetical protein